MAALILPKQSRVNGCCTSQPSGKCWRQRHVFVFDAPDVAHHVHGVVALAVVNLAPLEAKQSLVRVARQLSARIKLREASRPYTFQQLGVANLVLDCVPETVIAKAGAEGEPFADMSQERLLVGSSP